MFQLLSGSNIRRPDKKDFFVLGSSIRRLQRIDAVVQLLPGSNIPKARSARPTLLAAASESRRLQVLLYDIVYYSVFYSSVRYCSVFYYSVSYDSTFYYSVYDYRVFDHSI